MNPNEIQRQRVQAYHSRVRTELSKPSSMTSAEFYRQMERSMGTKLIRIPSKCLP
jgi:hypothetical protein